VYTSLVRLHDHYDMHATFSPGFPGLLEAFYVQEKIMQRMLPRVYAVFVSAMFLLGPMMEADPAIEGKHGLHHCLRRQMVYYFICQYRIVPDAIAIMGCILFGGRRYDGSYGCCRSLGL